MYTYVFDEYSLTTTFNFIFMFCTQYLPPHVHQCRECLVLEEDKKALRREFELKLYKAKHPDPKQRAWHDGYGTRNNIY